MARIQPGIADARFPSSMRASGNNVNMGGRVNSNVSPMANVSQSSNSVWDTNLTDTQKKDSAKTWAKRSKAKPGNFADELKSGAEFLGNEVLGIDDAKWAIKNASEGNWMEAAKSAAGGALELGGTVAAALAAVPSGGASLGMLGAKQAVKQGAKQLAKEGVEDLVKIGAKDAIKEGGEAYGRNAIGDTFEAMVKANKFGNIEGRATKGAIKDIEAVRRSKLSTGEMADEIFGRVKNPFEKPKNPLEGGGKGGKGSGGKEATGDGKGNLDGSGKSPTDIKNGPGGKGDGTGKPGGGGGALDEAKELVTVGAKQAGRGVDDLPPPPSFRPTAPPKGTKAAPGGSSSTGELVETVAEQALKSEPDAIAGLIKLRGPQFKGALGLAGLAGLGLGVMGATTNATQTALSAATATPTKTLVGTVGGGGGGGGEEPETPTKFTPPADETNVPYVF